MFAGNAMADDIVVQPFAIGPGQVSTVKVEFENTATDITDFQFQFKLPEGVYMVGVDRTATKNVDIPEDAYQLNTERVGTSPKDNITAKFRPKKEYQYSFNGSFSKGLSGTSGWVISFEVACDETVTANPAAELVINPEDGLCFFEGSAVANCTPAPVTVEVSDKFIAPCNADGYCTICPSVGLDLSGVDAYIVTGASGESVTLKKITELAAGDAAVVKGSGNVEIPLKSGATTSESGNKLVGVQSYTDTSGKAEYFLVGAEFVKAAATSHLAAGRAYLAGLGSGAKVLNLSFDDDATAIQSVEAEQNNGVLYNLNGVRVDNAVKGVYIQNGRKVVIK